MPKLTNRKIELREAFLELNNTCNFNCDFCPYPQMTRQQKLMERNDALKIIDEICDSFSIGTLSLHLYGEPMLHPNILEIAEYAQQKKLNVNLTTNGVHLSKDKLINFLEFNVWRIVLSVQHNRDQFGTRNSKSKLIADEYFNHVNNVVRCFFEYKNENPECLSKLEVHYLTTDDIKPNVNFVESDDDANKVITYWENELEKNIKIDSLKRKIYDDETGYLIELAPDTFLRFKPAITFGNSVGNYDSSECETGFCFFPSTVLAILSNGDIVPCCLDFNGEMILGNVFTDGGIKKVWEGKYAKSIRDSFKNKVVMSKRCRQCLGGSHFGSPI